MAPATPKLLTDSDLRGVKRLASASRDLPIFGLLTISVKRGWHFLAAEQLVQGPLLYQRPEMVRERGSKNGETEKTEVSEKTKEVLLRFLR
jgi:hypothetical protein